MVVASVPTLGKKDTKRLEKFNPEEFKLIVIDEVCVCARAREWGGEGWGGGGGGLNLGLRLRKLC